MTTEQGDVAVVIVNFRTSDLTAAAVRSVLDEPDVGEIVVVDNASGDGSPHRLRSELTAKGVRVVEADRNLGFGQGVNLGVRHSTAPLLFLLNSDAELCPGALSILRRTLLEDESIAVVAPAVYRSEGPELQPAAYGVFPTLRTVLRRTNHNPPETLWPDWVSGAAMLVRRSEFEAVGGFDPDLWMYLEDVDLCRRLRDRGGRVRRELAAGVVHRTGGSATSWSEAMRHAQASRVVYARKSGLPMADRIVMQALCTAQVLRTRITGH